MQTVTFEGTRGGVGTTTVALTYAHALATRVNERVLYRTDEPTDVACIAGVPAHSKQVTDHITLATLDPEAVAPKAEYEVFDLGSRPKEVPILESRFFRRMLVFRNDFLSLRHANEMMNHGGYERLIMIEDPNLPLGTREASEILSQDNLLVIPHTLDVARAVDAGTLLMRRPNRIRMVENLLPPVKEMA